MRKFAKLFESEDLGQILVTHGTDDEGFWEVRTTIVVDSEVVDDVSLAVTFRTDDPETGFNASAKVFEAFGRDEAIRVAREARDVAAGI